jgi:predicted metal-dependent HD superfamily phosphohydrolase
MGFVLPPGVREAVRRRYGEKHRRYHDLRHLDAVLGNLHVLVAHSREPGTDAVEAARLGALWHDAVYLVGAVDNEEASARLAQAELSAAGAPGALVAEVARLVRLTAHHDPTAPGAGPAAGAVSREAAVALDPAGALLCDADLAVLAGSDAEYARYRDDVRAEWPHLDDAAFDAGRATVVRGLLARRWLFLTPFAVEAWEERARRNLATELPSPRPW